MWEYYLHVETGNACLSRKTMNIETGDISEDAHWFTPKQQDSKEFKAFVKKWVK